MHECESDIEHATRGPARLHLSAFARVILWFWDF